MFPQCLLQVESKKPLPHLSLEMMKSTWCRKFCFEAVVLLLHSQCSCSKSCRLQTNIWNK